MAKTSAELASEFSARAAAFTELVRGLDDQQWQSLCEAENWSVGTTAHHVGQGFSSTWGMTDLIIANQIPPVTWDDINAMNAAHAEEFANPDKAETLALIETGAAQVAEAISAMSEENLDKAAVIPAFSPEPLAVRDWIEIVVTGHIGMHQPSIEAAVS